MRVGFEGRADSGDLHEIQQKLDRYFHQITKIENIKEVAGMIQFGS
jgi:hypothetical protein